MLDFGLFSSFLDPQAVHPWEATGALLNPQNEENIFSFRISLKCFLTIWWLLAPQMWDFGLSNSFLDPQVVLWKLIWTTGSLQGSS